MILCTDIDGLVNSYDWALTSLRDIHGGGTGRHGAAQVSDDDVIVPGGGPGEHGAAALAGRGLRMGLVARELVGGECSYWAIADMPPPVGPSNAQMDSLSQ